MKTFLIITLMALSFGALTACNVTARGEDGYISAGTNDGQYPRHCPPGHAKKGWC